MVGEIVNESMGLLTELTTMGYISCLVLLLLVNYYWLTNNCLVNGFNPFVNYETAMVNR